VVAFYTQASKQVAEVHEEAMRIAAIEKEKAAIAPPAGTETGYSAAGYTTIPESTSASGASH